MTEKFKQLSKNLHELIVLHGTDFFFGALADAVEKEKESQAKLTENAKAVWGKAVDHTMAIQRTLKEKGKGA